MTVKVGIPRALLYYEYYPMWKTFFEELGVQVILSDITTKDILNKGVKSCVDEACLPVKLFHGHVETLKDKVDYIFIPRLKSVSKSEYICPKFCGLPEMVKYSVKGLPPIIDTEINMRKSKEQIYKAFMKIGHVFIKDKRLIDAAYRRALQKQDEYTGMLHKGKYPFELLDNKKATPVPTGNLRIGLIGHVYNLYDSYISMDLILKLQQQGITVVTPEQIDEEIILDQAEKLPKKMFWTFGKRLMGTACHLMNENDIDGIIYIMSFGCGIDAFVADLCERKIRRAGNRPFFLLTLDEHSGEAGVNTRLEAFIDMVRWRKRNENNISAHG
ncbi:acyl-CoA dehydratase activase-related protein [Petroclostridium sp. X23]|uniref:acyl-CoA dehydratase activase-related protein n=1 Tax=Petroclostridium sp. X23 TaxID=3045146 RepID=UPI0024AC9C9C|nr:acyl-CoA dehydratase activase-related protein [Petroclostridium sp. X23]WHH60182.1 acyl-CoA dehydratase activase-related protein [Petroclostridium sp. X23]